MRSACTTIGMCWACATPPAVSVSRATMRRHKYIRTVDAHMYAPPSSPPRECTPRLRDRAPGRSDDLNQNVSGRFGWRTGKNAAGSFAAESTAVELEKLQTVKDVVHT